MLKKQKKSNHIIIEKHVKLQNSKGPDASTSIDIKQLSDLISHIRILEKAVFDPEYKSTKKFIFEAKNHLKKNGRLLIGFSTTLGKFEILEEFLNQAGFKFKCLAKTKSVETHPVLFELFEAVPSE